MKKAHEGERWVLIRCGHCDKEFAVENNYLVRALKTSKGRGPFCSSHCSMLNRGKQKLETIQKIMNAQKGVSVLSRGRFGHVVSEETRAKLRELKKVQKPTQTDWDVVLREVEHRGIKNGAIMTAPIPDYVFIDEHGKLAAIEIEKEKWESGVRTKMREYTNFPDKWDKVILVWYSPEGKRMKEWILENGDWRSD